MHIKVVFLGGARYRKPLDPTNKKKFRALSVLGEVFVVGFSNNLCPRRLVEHAYFYLLPKLPLPILRYAEMSILGPLLVLWLIFRHGVQVIVAQSPYEGVGAAVAKKVSGWIGYKVVLVVESHGDFERSLFLQRRIVFPKAYGFLMRRLSNFTLTQADLFRAVSNSTKEQLERLQPNKPIFKFAAWTDIDRFLQVGTTDNNKTSKTIVYAGVLIPLKGIHHLISAFAQVSPKCPESRLILIGREENKRYVAGLKQQIERAGMNTRVRFIGEVAQTELARFMRQASVFVLPSYSEGLPRVVFEAMAAGTPVIASAVSGIPDVVCDGETGFLVNPGDERTLAERIQWCLEKPEAAKSISRRAHAFVTRFFSTETYVQNYAQMFRASMNS